MTLFTQKLTLQLPVNGRRVIHLAFALLIFISENSYAKGTTVPEMPGPISGQVNVCAYVGTSQTITYSISAVAGAALYLWTVPSTVYIVNGQGTTNITVTFQTGFTSSANKQIRVRAISQDGNSADRILYLASQQPSTPASIVGPNNACIYIGTNNQATYTVSRDAAATGYVWGSNAAGTIVSHPNGAGVNDTIIMVRFKNGYKTSPITVQSMNGCGFSASRILTVSGAAPSTPGIISGPTNACGYMLPNGTTATYSISPVAGTTSYTWTTPANCIVTHPNGSGSADVSITVQYPSDFTAGIISVYASSGCDDSPPRSLNISKLNPSTPGVITPLLKVDCPDREYSYSLPSMPLNATLVNWTAPTEALSITGQGTATIIVAYPSLHVTGLVTATAVSNCATSATRQSVVNIYRCQVERGVNNNNTANRGDLRQAGSAAKKQVIPEPETMQVTILPNPSKGNFKLQVFSKSRDQINVKLLDLQGREVKKINIIQGQSLIFGNELRSGTYLLEVSQGKQKHTEKLLKL